MKKIKQIYELDEWLEPYKGVIVHRNQEIQLRKQQIAGYGQPLKDAINGALYYCLHQENGEWV